MGLDDMTRSLHLLYHEVRPVRSDYSYVVSCEEFTAHCELFAQMHETSDSGRLRPEITFDDGNRSDATYALPVLERLGLVGTFFITAGWTGKRKGFMDWPQLRELQAAGQKIGAHGLTHKLLTSCSPKELDEELRVARQVLEDGLGQQVKTLSLPGGRSNARVLQACRKAGYSQVFTSEPRAEKMDSEPHTVGRVNLVAGTSVLWLESLLHPDSGVLSRIQRADRAKSLAKKVLGDQLYARVWSLANRQERQTPDPEYPTT